MIAPAPP